MISYLPPGAFICGVEQGQEAVEATASTSPPATPRTPVVAASKSEPATPTLVVPRVSDAAMPSHGSRSGSALGCFRPVAAQVRHALSRRGLSILKSALHEQTHCPAYTSAHLVERGGAQFLAYAVLRQRRRFASSQLLRRWAYLLMEYPRLGRALSVVIGCQWYASDSTVKEGQNVLTLC